MSDKIPVYVINGFLEGGKTKFINFTVGQDYFAIEGRTLIVACEEGVEEYDKAYLDKNQSVKEEMFLFRGPSRLEP